MTRMQICYNQKKKTRKKSCIRNKTFEQNDPRGFVSPVIYLRRKFWLNPFMRDSDRRWGYCPAISFLIATFHHRNVEAL